MANRLAFTDAGGRRWFERGNRFPEDQGSICWAWHSEDDTWTWEIDRDGLLIVESAVGNAVPIFEDVLRAILARHHEVNPAIPPEVREDTTMPHDHVIPAVEPSVTIERIEQLAAGEGGASAEEQQALAQAVLRLMAHADNAATRVVAQATAAAGVLGLSLPLHASWTPGSITLFQGLMRSIAEEEQAARRADSQADLFGTLASTLLALTPRPAAPPAPPAG